MYFDFEEWINPDELKKNNTILDTANIKSGTKRIDVEYFRIYLLIYLPIPNYDVNGILQHFEKNHALFSSFNSYKTNLFKLSTEQKEVSGKTCIN